MSPNFYFKKKDELCTRRYITRSTLEKRLGTKERRVLVQSLSETVYYIITKIFNSQKTVFKNMIFLYLYFEKKN